MQGVAIGLRVDGNGRNAQFPTGADDADGDLTAVRDQDALTVACDNRSPSPSVRSATGGQTRVLTEHSVAAAAGAAGLPPDAARYVESTGSTNADLLAAADEGAPEWTVLVAGHQTAGRGRLGRTWEEPPGSSLLVSVLLRPSMTPARAPVASLAAGVAVAEAIEAVANLRVRCEWPNDVVTAEGHKLAGVLVESRIEGNRLLHIVVGSGVNLTQSPGDLPAQVRLPATSLAIEGERADANDLLAAYLRRLSLRYDRSAFQPTVLDAFRERCSTIGRRVRATTVDGTTVEGEATAVGDLGELIVATQAGEVAVTSAELERLG
jgi:BirA family biotin operon repressor/biotin-[acetyl-CoA-carboxylase] ligase